MIEQLICYLFPLGALSIINSPQNTTISENGSATFFCNATSYPPYQHVSSHITWEKLGDSSKKFPSGEQLVLQNVGWHDKGTYVCKAENDLGLPDTAAAVLDVLREYLPFVGQMKMSKIADCLLHFSNRTL